MTTFPSSFREPRATAGNGACASSDSSPLSSASEAGGDTGGRFTARNEGGPGNPYARRVAALRQALLDAVKPEDLQAIVSRLVEAAKQGDVAAARVVLAYTVGKPAPAVDPDALDLTEWQLWQQMPVSTEALAGLLGPLQAPLACILAHTILPLFQDTVAKQMAQHLDPKSGPQPGTEPAPPQPSCPAVQEASPSQAAPKADPALNPAPAHTPAPRTKKDPLTKRETTRRETGADGRAAGSVSGLAGSPNEEPGDPAAELTRWLELFERFVVPTISTGESPPILASGLPPEPFFED